MPLSSKLLSNLGLAELKKGVHAIPPNEKGDAIPHTNVYHNDTVHQADLLFLPTDKGFRYLLVVVDLHNGATDAEPLKGKDSTLVFYALQVIYKRSRLDWPNRLETDPGSEFKGAFKVGVNAKNVYLRYGKTNRHRQQATVESCNHTLGEALNLRMSAIEQITGQSSHDWVGFLPILLNEVNKQVQAGREGKRKDPADKGPRYGDKKGCTFIEEGTRVRVMLDGPEDQVTGERLHGKFRAGDIRWDPVIRKVYQILVRPDQPVLYIVTEKNSDKPEQVGYTKEQLQVVNESAEEPVAKKLNLPKNLEQYQVKEILAKKREKGRVFYQVRWLGFADKADWTWEPRSKLIKDVPELIKKFEAR